MSVPFTSKVPFGGDYNPEQWPEEVWQQEPVQVTARQDAIDLLAGSPVERGQPIRLDAHGVAILQ